MIEEIHKKLRENGLGRSNPEQVLAQVNEIHDYLRDISDGCFRGLRTDQLDMLQDLNHNMVFLMGFSKPKGGNYYSDYVMHTHPDHPDAKKLTTGKKLTPKRRK